MLSTPRAAALLSVLVLSALARDARAQSSPITLRLQSNQAGDFLIIGNTLAQDCAAGTPAPLVGTVGACGTFVDDAGADVFWRSNDPTPGAARADITIAPTDARSTAVLTLPEGATVTYARLYWAGTYAVGSASLTGPGGAAMPITHDVEHGTRDFRQRSAEVTELVRAGGSGPYTVSGALYDIRNEQDLLLFAGWSLVVFYERPGTLPRNLALFDGLDQTEASTVFVPLSGFRAPSIAPEGRLGIVAYEGDAAFTGDGLRVNETVISDASNPSSNFFNGTRSFLGSPVSTPGDLPRLSGEPGSSSLDIDVVDITAAIEPGDTSALIAATASSDQFVLGVLVTSISTLAPVMEVSKTVMPGAGASPAPGDRLDYTIRIENQGTDASEATVLRDPLPAGVTFVPGSIRLDGVPLTDQPGDDAGELDPATRSVVVRLGTGATAQNGGSLPIKGTSTVTFSVTVEPVAVGIAIANQAVVNAAGAQGAPARDFYSDDPTVVGRQPTATGPVVVCNVDDDCPAARPVCDAENQQCVECLVDDHCPDDTPRCDLDGEDGPRCVVCVSDADCPDTAPICELATGTCTGCVRDEDCSAPTPRCYTVTNLCVACLEDADCDDETRPYCHPDTLRCVSCVDASDCDTPLVCRIQSGKPSCSAEGGGLACLPSGNCGCASDEDCGGEGSVWVCDRRTGVCITDDPDTIAGRPDGGPSGPDGGAPEDMRMERDTGNMASADSGCQCQQAPGQGAPPLGGLLVAMALAALLCRARSAR